MNDIENELTRIPGFQFVHSHLLTSAQPSADQFRQIREYGVDTVINLAFSDADLRLDNEDKICVEIGLNYIQVPILWETPADDQCLFILDMIDHLVQEKTIWLHCAKSYRVSSLMYLYRQYYMDMDQAAAHELMQQIWEPNETWTGLIHAVALQLQGRKATRELQQSLMHVDHFI
ncbi:protein tyrosine phosphatase family protein [Acinetobacter sp. WZC-1]|uniref:protein tyrosine phosphatase family protein n=1 Tax=Acinetobacter sp. WZC-1 TaxID=3459034 RepID=UPI00403D9CDD